MKDFNRLPNFIILGAGKAGTTTLFGSIAQSPDVYAPPKKEIKFFSDDTNYQKGVEWYQDTFFNNAQAYPIRFEVTPVYITFGDKVAPRMKEVYEEYPIKFAVIFRDPVKRAYSHYWHRRRLGHDNLSFNEAIRTEDTRLKQNHHRLYPKGNALYGYYHGGCYASLLKPYLEIFPKSSFLFLLQSDLRTNFSGTMDSIFSFLEIESGVELEPIVSNAASVPRNKFIGTLYDSLKKTQIKRLYTSIIPRKQRIKIRDQWVDKPFQYPPMDPEIEDELYVRYQDEIKVLEKIIGRDLSHWRPDRNGNTQQ